MTSQSKIEEIASLLAEWYRYQLLSTFQPPSTQVVQPPHNPSPELIAEWEEAGMSPLVISVIKQLPYLSGEERRELAPDTVPLNYLEDDVAELWKDPFLLCFSEPPQSKYLGNCVILTDCKDQGGWHLIWDIETNEIFEVNAVLGETEEEQPEGSLEWYFRHYPHGPAPEILRKWIDKTKSLYWVPDFIDQMWMAEQEDFYETGKYEVMRLLYVQCGWPDNFRQHEFREKLEPVLKRLELKQKENCQG